ncbi:hypothetical protein MOQ72_36255 [Saccharopolyspora sp. K220]|uniref:hypothetical protein n=1 Tax=Saccharopolyspora soli TaxID=2926618 RepID=UPI001F593A90|nr:hypothetical protein [Saccharopolyspora soli]MCI2422892.1 hypothetical protein [Saccharopolyspora soli]
MLKSDQWARRRVHWHCYNEIDTAPRFWGNERAARLRGPADVIMDNPEFVAD